MSLQSGVENYELRITKLRITNNRIMNYEL